MVTTLKDQTFGVLLREARVAAGLSQSDLSQRSRLPKPTLSRYENGHVLPSLGTLRKLAEALDVPESALLPREKTPDEVFVDELRARGIRIKSREDAQELAEQVGELLSRETRLRRVD